MAVATAVGAYLLPGARGVRRLLRPVLGVRERLASDRDVALTFDDGPHPQGTPALLALLGAAGVHATFFLVGEHVDRHPKIAAEICAAGHEVALHCYQHRSELRRAPWRLRDDLLRGAAAITTATGREPRLYRPPYGVFSAGGLVLARLNGWEPVYWSRPSFDWDPSGTAPSIEGHVTTGLTGGDIVLMHDSDAYCPPGSWRLTLAALPRVLEAIEARGLRPALI